MQFTSTLRIKNFLFLSGVALVCCIMMACHHSRSIVPVVATSGSPIVLPNGSTLAFRTAEPIEWAQSMPVRAFAAVVSRDLNGNMSQLVLPSGSPITLTVLPTVGQTPNSGGGELGLASVMLNGDSFLVRNGNSSSANISGENTGAHLGIFAGGVPGTFDTPGKLPPAQATTELVVAGPKISIPNGSLLTFRLEQELVLVDARH